MKKILLSAFFILSLLPASAQFFVSANLHFNHQGYTLLDGFDNSRPSGMALDFSPQAGYAFSPRFKAGVVLTIANAKHTYTDGYFNPEYKRWDTTSLIDITRMTTGGGLFLRYTCCEVGKLSLSVELSARYIIGIGAKHTTEFRSSDNFPVRYKYPNNSTDLTFTLVPMLSYRFTDHWAMDAYIDLLSVAYTHSVYTQKKPVKVDIFTRDEPETDYQLITSEWDMGIHARSGHWLSLAVSYTF